MPERPQLLKSMLPLPTTYFLVSGVGDERQKLNAFDGALYDAGVGNVNLVRLSSTLSPKSRRIEPCGLPPGSLVPTAYSAAFSNVLGTRIGAAIAIARPAGLIHAGIIMEHVGEITAGAADATARQMAKRAMELRKITDFSLESISIDHVVKSYGCCFVGVVQL